MVDMKAAVKHLEKNITTLEKELYNFETVAMKRYDTDKEILKQMRADVVKIDSLMEKKANGIEITAEEITAALPEAFR